MFFLNKKLVKVGDFSMDDKVKITGNIQFNILVIITENYHAFVELDDGIIWGGGI